MAAGEGQRTVGGGARRAVRFLALSGLACGCGAVTELDVDVVVEEDTVTIYAREAARPCTCVSDWPAIGECRHIDSDAAPSCECEPPPAACLESVKLERDSGVVAVRSVTVADREAGVFSLEQQGLGRDPTSALVLSGCGGSARITLQAPDFPVATPGQFSADGDSVRIDWEVSGDADSAVFVEDQGTHADSACRFEVEGAISTTTECADGGGGFATMRLHVLSHAETQRCELGEFRVLAGRRSDAEVEHCGADEEPPPAALEIAPTLADFGEVEVGGTGEPVSFTVINVGEEATGLLTVALEDNAFEDFTVAADTCTGYSLYADDTCDIEISFAPSSAGAKTASLDVTANPGGTASAALTGSGVAARAVAARGVAPEPD